MRSRRTVFIRSSPTVESESCEARLLSHPQLSQSIAVRPNVLAAWAGRGPHQQHFPFVAVDRRMSSVWFGERWTSAAYQPVKECTAGFQPAEARFGPILLQKSLMTLGRSDSVVVMRFAVEAGDDGAAQARP